MLSGTFYTLGSVQRTGNPADQVTLEARVFLVPGHPIYDGHFPGQPVVPGVCQVQMVQELTSMALDMPLRLVASDNIKFMSMIDPGTNPELDFSLTIRKREDGPWSVSASIRSEASVFLKFSGKFEPRA